MRDGAAWRRHHASTRRGESRVAGPPSDTRLMPKDRLIRVLDASIFERAGSAQQCISAIGGPTLRRTGDHRLEFGLTDCRLLFARMCEGTLIHGPSWRFAPEALLADEGKSPRNMRPSRSSYERKCASDAPAVKPIGVRVLRGPRGSEARLPNRRPTAKADLDTELGRWGQQLSQGPLLVSQARWVTRPSDASS